MAGSLGSIATEKIASKTKTGSAAEILEKAGAFILRYGLVFVLVLWGTAKWTKAEAEGIEPLVSHSPLMSWIYRVMSVQHGSELIGVAELIFALLIVTRRWLPKISAIGSIGCIFMFLTTLSFLATTPGLDDSTQGFLIKDIFLLGAAMWTAGEALRAAGQSTR